MNIFGTNYRIMLIGSSHGNLVGVVIDGVPAAEEIDIGEIEKDLMRRAPGQSKVTTQRKERDKLVIEAGILNGKTTGEPIVAFVRNKDVDSSYYDEIKDTPRPGHADYPAFVKYKGANDYRGGGRFSGRMTIGLVIAGSIAKQILRRKGVSILAYTKAIGSIDADVREENLKPSVVYDQENIVRSIDPELVSQMTEAISNAKKAGDSLGGIVECQIRGLPVGVGEPIFDSIESKLAHIAFSIPATKGIEFGSGFMAARMRGSEHNDPYIIEDGEIKTLSNNAGGILGGLSNGMPVVFRIAFKPTSSISIKQQTVNQLTKEKAELKVRGRHDPCIVPRAVPIVENSAAIVMLDLMLAGGFIGA